MGRKLAWVLLVAALGLSSSVAALGLGAIDADTLLNEPLSARIPLLSVSPEEAKLVKVELAPPATFERAGLARLFSLTRLQFEVRTDGGQPYVLVTTDQPVKEPFLDFLVQVRWPNGRLVREYTVLLNPPIYDPATGGAGLAVAAGRDGAGAADVAPEALAAPATVVPPPRAVAEVPAPATVRTRATARSYGPVRANETLWSIANRLRPGTLAEINQAMVAILRANPDAFIDGNINELKRGAVLRIPTREAIDAISAEEATALVRRQAERWQASRMAVADSTATGSGDALSASEVAVAGEVTDTGAETAATEPGAGEAAVAEDAVDGRLSVVAPENSSGVDATTSLTSEDLSPTKQNIGRLQSEVVSLEEHSASLESANSDLRAQVEALKQELANLRHAINLRMEQALPSLGAGSGEPPLAMPAAAIAETGAETAGEAALSADTENAAEDVTIEGVQPSAAEPVVAEAPQPPVAASPEPVPAAEPDRAESEAAQPPPTLLETLLSDTSSLAMAAGAGLLLLLLLLLLLRRRRGAGGTDDSLDAEMAAPAVGGTAFAAAGEQAATAGGETREDKPAGADDALEEAEVYVAYGRYDQAQEVLDRALGEDPDNRALRARLLEILAKQGDRGGFEAEAQVLHTQLDDESDPLWQRTVALGREIAPEHPLFSADAGADAGYEPDMAVAPAGASSRIPDESDADPKWPTRADDGDDTAFSLTAEESAPAEVGVQEFAIDAADDPESDDALSDLEFELPNRAEPPTKTIAAYDESGTDDAGDDFGLDFSLDDEDAAEPHSVGARDLGELADDADDSDEFGALEFEIPEEDISSEPLPDRRRKDADGLHLDDAALDDDGDDEDEAGDEVGTKLDLARAYLDMGDADGARGLLDEVVEEGSDVQKTEAQRLLTNVG